MNDRDQCDTQQKARVQAQFGSSAAAYATSDVHARGESLDVLVELVNPQSTWNMLDLATGAGHTARTFARFVKNVLATDLTDQMLTTAAQLATKNGIHNFRTQFADAESLPISDEQFDLITCRLALHHFPNPEKALTEAFRVLKRPGWLGFTDNYSVDEKSAADYYNDFERLRDPSHVYVYSLGHLKNMIESAGFQIAAERQMSKEFEFQQWANRQNVDDQDESELLRMIREIPADLLESLHPRWTDDTLYFTLRETVIVGHKLG